MPKENQNPDSYVFSTLSNEPCAMEKEKETVNDNALSILKLENKLKNHLPWNGPQELLQ